jgi:hypothetical protein
MANILPFNTRKKGRFYGGPYVPRQEQIHHGKSKFITAKANSSRQKQIHHGKSKLLTARANYSRQEQITHGKTKIKSLVSGLVSGCSFTPLQLHVM